MSPRRAEISRRVVRWLLPTALLALMPKCVLCVLAYVGVGAALGLGGPEWCRAAGDTAAPWTTVLAWAGGVGMAVLIAAVGVLAVCRRARARS